MTPRRTSGAVEINHAGLRRVANVLVNIEGRDLASVASDIEARVSKLELPEGMRISYKGEFQRMNDSFTQLALGLALAAVLVYLLQGAESDELFRSRARKVSMTDRLTVKSRVSIGSTMSDVV